MTTPTSAPESSAAPSSACPICGTPYGKRRRCYRCRPGSMRPVETLRRRAAPHRLVPASNQPLKARAILGIEAEPDAPAILAILAAALPLGRERGHRVLRRVAELIDAT